MKMRNEGLRCRVYRLWWLRNALHRIHHEWWLASSPPPKEEFMEKRGVVSGENEQPADKSKEAADKTAQGTCGDDTASRLAEAIASDTVTPYKVIDPAKK